MDDKNKLYSGIIRKKSKHFVAEIDGIVIVNPEKTLVSCQKSLFKALFAMLPKTAFVITYSKSGTKYYFYVMKKGF